MVLDSLRVGVPLAVACRAAGVKEAAALDLAREDSGWAFAMSQATLDGQTANAAQASASGWSDAVKASAALDAGAKPTPKANVARALALSTPAKRDAPVAVVTSDRWARAHEDAASLGPGAIGHLLWVERKCVDAGLHPMDRQWLWHFSEFYESGKSVDLVCAGLRAAKSASAIRAVAAEVAFTPRILEPGLSGVCPVMAQNMREASDRFDTTLQVLRACGFADLTGKRPPRGEDEDSKIAPWAFRASGGGSSARVIALLDSQDHEVEFRIYPASVSGAAGFTGIAGFCDEVDLWGRDEGANPAERVIDILLTRYTTQPNAKLHIMSAPYYRRSYFVRMVDEGDTPLVRIGRLGIDGAVRDESERRRLARLIGSVDPLLLKPADVTSVCIPTWVSNPTAPIEQCFKGAKGDVAAMFARFGGQPSLAEGDGDATAQILGLAEANAAWAASINGSPTRHDNGGSVAPMKVAGARPGDARYAGPTAPAATPFTPWDKESVF